MKKWLKWLKVKVRYLRKQCKNMPDGRKKRYLSFHVTIRVVFLWGWWWCFQELCQRSVVKVGFFDRIRVAWGRISQWRLAGLSENYVSPVAHAGVVCNPREMFTLLRISSADLQRACAAHYHTPAARYLLQGNTGTYL